MNRTQIALSALVILGGFAVPDAWAQGAPADAKEQAREFFQKGRRHYADGELAPALDAFKQASALRPHPLMLFNIAQVFEAMEDPSNAIVSYEAYLQSNPDDAAAVRKTIAGLRDKQAAWPVVSFTTTPTGASIRVGNREHPPRGVAPVDLPIPPGARTIYFTLDGHHPEERSVSPAAGQKQALSVAMRKIEPRLTIRTEPAGATVSIGEALTATTPAELSLPMGEHTARIELEGYEPVERAVTLDASHIKAPLIIEVPLERAIPTGQLVVLTSGDGVTVRIDGESVGLTPLSAPLVLKQGMHQLELIPPEGDTYREMVNVRAGETTRTEVDIGPSSGWSGPSQRTVSYIVMGVGAAALIGGGITGAMAMGTSGDLDSCRKDVACNRTDRELNLADDVRSQALTTDILLGAGIAVAATGVVLFLLSDDAPATPSGDVNPGDGAPAVSWGIAPTPDGAAAFGLVRF